MPKDPSHHNWQPTSRTSLETQFNVYTGTEGLCEGKHSPPKK